MYLSNPDLRGISDGDIEYEDWQIKELAKCKRDPLHFILTYIKVVDGDKGLIPFQPREYSIEFIKNIHSNNYTLVKFPRQSGKSITVAAYLVWYIIFNKKKNAVILAHQKSMATEQLSRIKAMIQEIPLWMQQPVLKWNESSIAFANDSKIVSSATQQKSVRGFTVNFLYLDEFAFVEPHIANGFISSVFPTISSMESAKVVVTSTPNGLNHFHKMWSEAKTLLKAKKLLEPKDWRTLEIPWDAVPGRNEAWKKNEINKIGEVRFKQEYECEFLGSVATLVDAKYLKDLGYKVPIAILDGDRLRIYEYPKNPQEMTDKGFEYLITVDPAMGTMQDYSVCQVWLVESNTKIRQVAVYESNDIPPKKYIEKIYTLAKLYNEAAVIVETMEQAGGVIIDGLHYAKNYPNLIHMNEKGLGFNMSHNRKIEACVYLQVYMEKGLIEIVDHRTITQMSMFGKKGNTYKALSDGHDDLITPILAMLYYVNSAYFYGNIDEEPIYKKKTVAEEFSGIEEVTDENVRNIVNSWHDRSENEEYAPIISSPNNPHTFNNNHFLYGQDVRY